MIEQNQESTNKGIFINGKQQMIDMLRIMSPSEKQKLLRNIAMRNSSMAKELMESSMSFEALTELSDDNLRIIFSQVPAAIAGLAIKFTSQNFQRKILSLMNRHEAETAYSILVQNLSHKKAECNKAQRKVLEVAVSLSRQNLIKMV